MDQSHLTIEPLPKELASNASAQLPPDKTLSNFKNFLSEQLNMESQWEVANSETSYPSLYQNFMEGKFMFFGKKLSKSSEFFHPEPDLFSFTDIVEAMNTLIQETERITAKTVSQLKFLEERKKLRITLQLKDLVLLFLV